MTRGPAREGESLDEIKASSRCRSTRRGGTKEWFPMNIEGMYRLVQNQRRPN